MESRKIILDTETTGLKPEEGHRIIEIACVEIIDGKITGNHYQTYINPQRDSHPEAFKVHGLTTAFLADKPKFAEIADHFLKFISGAELIIHNAPFDVGFLNHELKLAGKELLKNKITDTRVMAQNLYTKEFLTQALISNKLVEDEALVQEERAKHSNDEKLIAELIKNSSFRVHSLDHLCKYYRVSLATREKSHGALIDCELLAQVYFHLQKISELNRIKSPALFNPTTERKNEVFNPSIITVNTSQSTEPNADIMQLGRQKR